MGFGGLGSSARLSLAAPEAAFAVARLVAFFVVFFTEEDTLDLDVLALIVASVLAHRLWSPGVGMVDHRQSLPSDDQLIPACAFG